MERHPFNEDQNVAQRMEKKGRGGYHNLLVHHIFQKQFSVYASRHLSGKLIDIGCGVKPWNSIVAPYVAEHIGVDHKETLHGLENVDLIGTAYSIPVADDTFDCAICTAVLEHLEEPFEAILECKRVLKPRGIAIYSIPFIWHIHEEPRDFYRYSSFGINYLFQKADFEILELKALSGFWVTFGQASVYYLFRFNRGVLKWLRIIVILGLLIQGVAYLLDKVDKAEKWTWMYMVVVKKPEVKSPFHI